MAIDELEIERPRDQHSGSDVRTRRAVWAPLLAWAALVGTGAYLVYETLVVPGTSRFDGVPLHATYDPRITIFVLLPILVATIVVLNAVRLAQALAWSRLLWASVATAALWSMALAGIRGWIRITGQLRRPDEYLAVVPRIHSLGSFLNGFAADIKTFPTHVQGHPPGFVTLAWAMRHIGLGGPIPMSFLCIGIGAGGVAATLITVREVAGEGWARRAAPFVALSPAALWIATSADAFYTGAGATAVALVVLATGRHDRRGDGFAIIGGILFGITAFLSYGLVLLATIPIVIAIQRRRARPIALAAIGAASVFLAFLAAGFWWFDGLQATRAQYFVGIARRRPYELFLIANLSSFAIALGPAIAVGLWRLRDRRMWLVAGAALLAVALADVSGMSKAEVERIWLPFTPLVLAAGGALVAPITARDRSRGSGRLSLPAGSGWLGIQAGTALLVEISLRTAW